ncbi:unnamed protein product, partial [Callosobruchus maculatus]
TKYIQCVLLVAYGVLAVLRFVVELLPVFPSSCGLTSGFDSVAVIICEIIVSPYKLATYSTSSLPYQCALAFIINSIKKAVRQLIDKKYNQIPCQR